MMMMWSIILNYTSNNTISMHDVIHCGGLKFPADRHTVQYRFYDRYWNKSDRLRNILYSIDMKRPD
jgi:hypothetical protein